MPNDRAIVLSHLLEVDPEAWCRLKGAIAILSLPSLRRPDRTSCHRMIEVEVEPGVWELADRVTFAELAVVFVHGVNGHTKRYTFDVHAIPRWRTSETAREA